MQWKKDELLFMDKEWSEKEILAFEDAIQRHGAELCAIRDEVVTRSMPEVVRFYGHYKKVIFSFFH